MKWLLCLMLVLAPTVANALEKYYVSVELVPEHSEEHSLSAEYYGIAQNALDLDDARIIGGLDTIKRNRFDQECNPTEVPLVVQASITYISVTEKSTWITVLYYTDCFDRMEVIEPEFATGVLLKAQ